MPNMPMPPQPDWTTTGGVFARIGAYGGILNAINLSRGTTIPTHVTSINNQFLATNQDVIDNLYSDLAKYQNAASAFNSPIKSMSSATIIEMMNDLLLLNNNNLNTALIFLISQMEQYSQTVKRCVVSSNSTYFPGNIGNPNLVSTVKDINGAFLEYTFNELCSGVCTRDSQQSASLAGIEQFQIKSQMSITDTFSYLYPQGSGITVNLNAVSGLVSNAGGVSNWLVGGSFETWISTATATGTAIPQGWHVGTGTPGSTIIQSQSIIYDGLSALNFAGNGSEDTSIYQQFSSQNSTGDMASLIYPNMIFAFNMFIRVDSTPAAGVLRAAMTDGVTPILDNSGTSNSVSVNLNTISTTWVPISSTWRTPNQLPDNIFLELGLTTPLTSSRNVYIDRCALTQMIQLYAGGPYVALFSGNINMINGDTIWLNELNDYGGQFQWLFQKLYNMRSQPTSNNISNLILPSSASPTISDTLIA